MRVAGTLILAINLSLKCVSTLPRVRHLADLYKTDLLKRRYMILDLGLVLVVITVLAALTFDFLNGFHDAANSIATVVSAFFRRK